MFKMREKSTEELQVSNILISGVAGAIIGAAAGLCLAPKTKEHHFSDEIYKKYQDVTKMLNGLEENIEEKGKMAFNTAACYAADIKDNACDLMDKVQNIKTPLLMGALGAGILGASALLYLSSKNTTGHKASNLTSHIQSVDWKNVLKEVVEILNNNSEENREDEGKESDSDAANNAIEWAMLGLRLWKNMKERR